MCVQIDKLEATVKDLQSELSASQTTCHQAADKVCFNGSYLQRSHCLAHVRKAVIFNPFLCLHRLA